MMLVQQTKILEKDLKEARIIVDWDGTPEMFDLIKKEAHSCVELLALGVRESVITVLQDITTDSEVALKNLDYIILKDTGQTILVIVNTSIGKNMKIADNQLIRFKVNPKNVNTHEYHWPEYCPTAFDSHSMIVHHIHNWTPKHKVEHNTEHEVEAKPGILTWLGLWLLSK